MIRRDRGSGLACARQRLLVLALGLLAGCGWLGSRAQPGWVNGQSQEYPPNQYLVGIGEATDRDAASKQAYTAVAKIFKAEINAQARDWESYLVIESRGQANTERRLTLDNVTRVSTDKVLENVQILDTWFDRKTYRHHVLAGMNRLQAESAVVDRITELDRMVDNQVTEARQTQDKLAHVRSLKRAAKNLVVRDAHNADLRVIRSSGRGNLAAYRVSELTSELEQYLSANLAVAVEVSGEQAEPVERAITEGLIREGLPVTGRRANAGSLPTGSDNGPVPDLLVKGLVRLWPIDVRDPQFKYVRWCSDFVIQELSTHRIVGAVAKGGKEGHLTSREATAKALRVMQQEFSSDLAKTIAGYVYGNIELPTSPSPSAGCPRGETGGGEESTRLKPM